MRTTMTLADDVAAEIHRLRREQGMGVSEAANLLIRRGIAADSRKPPYRHTSIDVGIKIDIANIADVLELLDDSR